MSAIVARLTIAVLATALAGPGLAAPMIAGCPSFPADNIWNARIDTLPVDANSDAYVASVGADTALKADFASALYDGVPIGIPYVVVPFRSSRVEIVMAEFDGEGPYDAESDVGTLDSYYARVEAA